MSINVRLIREQVICENAWTPRKNYNYEIIARETIQDWHRFYPLDIWAKKKKDWEDNSSFHTIELTLDDLKELYDVAKKTLETQDKKLLPEGEVPVSRTNPDYYWSLVGELEMYLKAELRLEKARLEAAEQPSRYFIDSDW